MAKPITVTDPDIVDLIVDKKQSGNREEFVGFMQERKKLTDEFGHAEAETKLKTKHADAIAKVKEKKAKKK